MYRPACFMRTRPLLVAERAIESETMSARSGADAMVEE